MYTSNYIQDCQDERSIPQKEGSFHLQNGMKFKKKTIEIRRLERRCVCGAKIWTLRKVDNKYLEKIWNVVLVKDGKHQLAGSCEKLRSITQSEGEKEYRIEQKKEG